MPDSFAPMKAALADRPARRRVAVRSQVGRRAGHLFLDDADEDRSASSPARHRCERQYPELSVIPHYIAARQAMLDGEIAALDEKGVAASN